jgi:hypothetical protein
MASTGSYKAWWESLPQPTRKNVRRAAKRGIKVAVVALDEQLVEGIRQIYDETPIRQGRRFWHHGKDLAAIKRENETYPDRSEFLGAYCGDELVGFIKMIYVDQTATIIQILSKNQHQDKRPGNALLAKAVEVCAARGKSFLIYGNYRYEGNEESPLQEFKRRNGFEEVPFPRYYVPLTIKGRMALQVNVHRGLKNALPAPMIKQIRLLRERFYQYRFGLATPTGGSPSSSADE